MSVTECMLSPTPEIIVDDSSDTASLTEILALLRSKRNGAPLRAAWHRFFADRDNCQAFLDAILAGEYVPMDALLRLAREQFNMRLFDVMAADPRWAADAMPGAAGWSETAAILWWQRQGFHGNAQRVAELADLPATPETDARLAELHRVLTEGGREDVVIALNDMRNHALLRAKLMQSFADGFTIADDLYTVLGRQFHNEDLPAAWSDTALFDDDANFTPQRFIDHIHRAKELGLNLDAIMEHAIAQAHRMLATGQVELGTLEVLKGVHVGGDAYDHPLTFGDVLGAYDDSVVAQYDHMLSFTASRMRNPTPQQQRMVEMFVNRREAIMRERERLFQQTWLPAIIGSEAAAALKDLPSGFLRELYPTQWEQGYLAFCAAVQEREAQVVGSN